jgi:hypothetical protein
MIDGVTYAHDVVIDRGEVCTRKNRPSKQFREQLYVHLGQRRIKVPQECFRAHRIRRWGGEFDQQIVRLFATSGITLN